MIEKISQMLGGKARAEKLTPERRAEIAKKAAAARWEKKAAEAKSPQPEPATKTVTTGNTPEPAPTQPARAPEPAGNPYDFLPPTERPGVIYWEDGDREPSDRYVRAAAKQKRKSWWSCAPY